nr:hypothetical protein [Tanacetum cinerariifolium]
YNAVPPPAADIYLSPKKDLSWTGQPKFVDDTVTDYSRPSPTVVSTSTEGEGYKGRQLGLKSMLMKVLHTDMMVTDHMVLGVRPYKSFFIQSPSYETRPFLKSSAVKTPYRAPWVPTINRYDPPVNRKFSIGRRNFPTANRKFPTASRKFTTGSIKNHTADAGRKGKAVKPSACWTW